MNLAKWILLGVAKFDWAVLHGYRRQRDHARAIRGRGSLCKVHPSQSPAEWYTEAGPRCSLHVAVARKEPRYAERIMHKEKARA